MANENEAIVRFLSSKGDFSVTKGLVKRTAFTPYPRPFASYDNPNNGRPETSVTCCSSNSDEVVARWEEYGKPRGKLFGWAIGLTESNISQYGLLILKDEPPRHHSVIVGWPTVNNLWDKSESMGIEQSLADCCSLHLVPPPCPRE